MLPIFCVFDGAWDEDLFESTANGEGDVRVQGRARSKGDISELSIKNTSWRL
ncbi:hypothetical protein [Desulfosporosinus sp. SB140]|uniref:hypothetical protein n=1 Tax=Desulfosporosinus paludis TaxID=3115649 RepID=UPI00388EB40D